MSGANRHTAPPARLRTWKDASGKYTIRATLVQVENGVVELKKQDGAILKVPVAKLSQVDQRYLRTQQKK